MNRKPISKYLSIRKKKTPPISNDVITAAKVNSQSTDLKLYKLNSKKSLKLYFTK